MIDREDGLTTQKETGSVLDGKYEVLDHLGEGGEGQVYLVRHIHLEEKRVIKILRADRVGDPSAQRRFLREARFATQIKNPHVAVLYDYSRLDDGSFYMVWEHIEGHHIGQHLSTSGALPVPLSLDLAIQTLTGLQAIHAAGIIHRDVSPDNLMVFQARDGSHQVKIIDLGLAKDLQPDPEAEVTQAGMFMGKLKYCAPEQAGLVKGESIDHRADLYSFALVLYEMVCGQPPFEAETAQGAVFKRLSEDPMPMHDRVPGISVPRQLEAVVLKGLTRDREGRFADAASFIAALDRVRKGLDAAATREIPSARPAAELQQPVAQTSHSPSSSGLSRAERLDLLAQIDRAARRRNETSKAMPQAEAFADPSGSGSANETGSKFEEIPSSAGGVADWRAKVGATRERGEAESAQVQRGKDFVKAVGEARQALIDGRLDDATELLERAEDLDGESEALASLKADIEARRGAQTNDARIVDAEAMVSGYIQKKQPKLARLALTTLKELSPEHPNLGELSSWIKLLEAEVKDEARAAELLEQGREALRHDDPKTARRRLGALKKVDPEQAELLAGEIEASAADRRADEVLEVHRERFDRALDDGDLDRADAEVTEVGNLGVARVTVDLMRSQLDEARLKVQQGLQASELLVNFQQRIDAGDWHGARDLARQLQTEHPDHPRAAGLLEEVDERFAADGKRRAIEAGIEQVRGFIRTGEVDQAELALKVLAQMEPTHPLRPELEQAIAGLRA